MAHLRTALNNCFFAEASILVAHEIAQIGQKPLILLTFWGWHLLRRHNTKRKGSTACYLFFLLSWMVLHRVCSELWGWRDVCQRQTARWVSKWKRHSAAFSRSDTPQSKEYRKRSVIAPETTMRLGRREAITAHRRCAGGHVVQIPSPQPSKDLQSSVLQVFFSLFCMALHCRTSRV